MDPSQTGMDLVSFMTDDSTSLSGSELMAWLDRQTFSSDSSESQRLHEMRRAARTTPAVNRLLVGASAHVDYGLASGGYGVQQSGRPTSMPHYTAPRQFDNFFSKKSV
jgi:hypothetical protein